MNKADAQDAIVRFLQTYADWMPAADLISFLATELELTRGQGVGDLRALVASGRIEARPSATVRNRFNTGPAKEYRAKG
jgi:hypothetical protein